MTRRKSILLTIASFVLPGIIMLGALAGLHITPFGDNSLAISDGNGLYINYMGYISKVLHGQEGITYSFTKGLGGNMMGSWAWFLLNPVFVLFALTDITNYMQMFTYVSVLSFCLCGLTMYICLKDFYGHRVDNLIFSTAYAMNGFLVANVFQLNFFVVIPVLPIMVMGLSRVLKGKSPAVYTLSLAYALLTNFYFGFMLCVASVLIFIVFFFTNAEKIQDKKAVAIRYVVFSILAGGLSSVVWLPAILSLRGGRLDQSVAGIVSFKENMPFLDMFSKLFIGANSTSELSNGLPNIFVGIFPLFLVILFFINSKISVRKKRAAAVLLLFYLISFYIVAFNMAMHGGTVTNWFNYRDSFVFCFIMIMIAAEEWQAFADEPWDNLKRGMVILTVASLIVFNKRFEYVSGGMVLLDFALLVVIFGAFLMYKKDPVKNPARVLTLVVLIMTCLDMYLNYYFSVKNIMEWSHSEKEYLENVLPVSALVDGVKNSDSGFYRMEVEPQRSGTHGNDPMLYGYYGVGHAGSDEKDFVRLALCELGVHRFDLRTNYGRGITSATDDLLGLKYIISKEDLFKEKGYKKLVNIADYSLFKNENALPFVVVADKEIEDVSLDIEDVFDNLNRTWSAMTGVKEKVFVSEEKIEFSSHNSFEPFSVSGKEAEMIVAANYTNEDSTNKDYSVEEAQNHDAMLEESVRITDEMWSTSLEEPEDTNYIKFTFESSYDGEVYTYNRSGMLDNGSFIRNLNFEGYYRKGDTVTGYIPVTNANVTKKMLEEVAGQFKVVYQDRNTLNTMCKKLLERPTSVSWLNNGHIKGTFTIEDGQMPIFIIPYDNGWSLLVDGKKRELKNVIDVFMSADVENGEHKYELIFVPEGVRTGAIVTLISFLIFMISGFINMKRD